MQDATGIKMEYMQESIQQGENVHKVLRMNIKVDYMLARKGKRNPYFPLKQQMPLQTKPMHVLALPVWPSSLAH